MQRKSGPINDMVSKSNYIVQFFNNNSPRPYQFLRYNKPLKKIQLGEMLIEQIIEFELSAVA